MWRPAPVMKEPGETEVSGNPPRGKRTKVKVREKRERGGDYVVWSRGSRKTEETKRCVKGRRREGRGEERVERKHEIKRERWEERQEAR